jgi:hypothetical protein
VLARPPTRRAIPTAANAGRVVVNGGWHQNALSGTFSKLGAAAAWPRPPPASGRPDAQTPRCLSIMRSNKSKRIVRPARSG